MCDKQLDAAQHLQLPEKKRQVAITLARFATPEGHVKASIRKLAGLSGVSPHGVTSCLRELIDAGLIQVVSRHHATYRCRFRPLAGGW